MNLFKKNTRWLAALSLAVLVTISGCDSELTSSDTSTNEGLGAVNGNSGISNLQTSKLSVAAEQLKAFAEEHNYDNGVVDQKIKELTPHTADRSNYRQFVENQVVDSSKYQCGPTDLDEWVSNNLFYASFQDAMIITGLGLNQYPYLYNLIFVNPDDERQYFGYEGEYTRQIRRADRSLKRFWDVNLKDVQVEGFHGSMLADFDKVFRLVEVLYPNDSEESNAEFSQLIVELVTGDPIYNNGDAPIFSFNAFAFREGPILIGGEDVPNQIQMGDGIMDGLDAVGNGDAAPQAVLAHEMAHQVQFELNVFLQDTITDPVKSIRRTEMMADAFAAYYLGHKRGASMNWDRVDQFMQAFYSIGDCGFTSSGHHGTPNQRLKAAEFGFKLAENADRRVQIMSAADFVNAFDDILPELLEPDAEDYDGPGM